MPLNNNALFIANYVAIAQSIQKRCVQYGKYAYSQTYRNKGYSGTGAYCGHEAYDCASFVWFALKGAGYPVGNGWPFVANKGSMDAYLTQARGWHRYPFNARAIKKGDILLRDGEHTEIALSNTKSIGAKGSSYGVLTDMNIGTNWTYYYRYTGDTKYTPIDEVADAVEYSWIEKVNNNAIVYLSKSELENNAICFYITAKSYGWSDESIAGMLGCIEMESGINPGQQGLGEKYGWSGFRYLPDEYGIGLVMWTFSLHKQMVDFVSQNYGYWYNGNGQMEFLRNNLYDRNTRANINQLNFIPADLRFNNGEDFAKCDDPRWTVEMATAWFLACYTAGYGDASNQKYYDDLWNRWFPKRYEYAQKWYKFLTGLDIDGIVVDGYGSTDTEKHKMPLWMMVKRRPKIYIYY